MVSTILNDISRRYKHVILGQGSRFTWAYLKPISEDEIQENKRNSTNEFHKLLIWNNY